MKLADFKEFLPYLLFPLLLILLFYLLPMELQNQFAFTASNPVWYTRFTASFFHNSTEHLVSNVSAIVVILLVIWLFAWKAKKTNDLWKIVLLVILTTPLLTSSFTQIYTPTLPLSRGASDILFALLGLIPAFILLSLDCRNSFYYWASGILAILLVGAAIQGQTTYVEVLAILQYPIFFYLLLKKDGTLLSKDGVLVFIAVLLLPLIILSGFPIIPVYNGSMVGVFQHYVGLAWGLIVGWIYLFRFSDGGVHNRK